MSESTLPSFSSHGREDEWGGAEHWRSNLGDQLAAIVISQPSCSCNSKTLSSYHLETQNQRLLPSDHEPNEISLLESNQNYLMVSNQVPTLELSNQIYSTLVKFHFYPSNLSTIFPEPRQPITKLHLKWVSWVVDLQEELKPNPLAFQSTY